VAGYVNGDLERRYPRLALDEGFFINYGFLPRAHYFLMHPRARSGYPGQRATLTKRMRAVLAFIQAQGSAHPREVDAHFDHGRVTNYWGGSSNATTHLLQAMHYRGLLRVVRRDRGIRVYAAQEQVQPMNGAGDRRARIDGLIDIIMRAYAPMPAGSFTAAVSRLRYSAPQLAPDIRPAVARAKARLASAVVDGIVWYWPENETPAAASVDDAVRLLTPFDPIVWDRRRFELLWGWAYRFEAYTPKVKRQRGYYALPLLWRDRVIGWANVSAAGGSLACELGFVDARPRDRAFDRAIDAELERLRAFLRLDSLRRL
jgi:uncharacterized protein YcaQ